MTSIRNDGCILYTLLSKGWDIWMNEWIIFKMMVWQNLASYTFVVCRFNFQFKHFGVVVYRSELIQPWPVLKLSVILLNILSCTLYLYCMPYILCYITWITICLITLQIMFRLNTGRSYSGTNVILPLDCKSNAVVICDPEFRSGGRVTGRHIVYIFFFV
jgi:hypothetical protein